MPGPSAKPSIFISYAHEDQPEQAAADKVQWRSYVIGYLQPAVSQGVADVWFDNLLRGGDPWDQEIKPGLRRLHPARFAPCAGVQIHSRHRDAIIKERQKNREEVHCYPLLLTTTPSYALDPVRDWIIRPPNLRPFGSYPPDERDQHTLDAAENQRARKLQTFQ